MTRFYDRFSMNIVKRSMELVNKFPLVVELEGKKSMEQIYDATTENYLFVGLHSDPKQRIKSIIYEILTLQQLQGISIDKIEIAVYEGILVAFIEKFECCFKMM